MRLTTSKYTSKNFDLNIELKAIASQMKQSAGYFCIFLDGFLDWLFNHVYNNNTFLLLV